MKALRSRTWGRKHCSPFLRGGKTDCRGAAYLSISASTRRRSSSPILIATLTVAIGIALGNTELAFQGELFRWRVRQILRLARWRLNQSRYSMAIHARRQKGSQSGERTCARERVLEGEHLAGRVGQRARGFRENIAVKRERPSRHRVETEFLADAAGGGGAISGAQLGVVEQAGDRGGERFGLARRDRDSGHPIDRDERHSRIDSRVDYGPRGGHRFELNDAECLAAGDRGQHEDIGSMVVGRDRIVLDFTGEKHTLVNPERAGEFFESRAQRAVADD